MVLDGCNSSEEVLSVQKLGEHRDGMVVSRGSPLQCLSHEVRTEDDCRRPAFNSLRSLAVVSVPHNSEASGCNVRNHALSTLFIPTAMLRVHRAACVPTDRTKFERQLVYPSEHGQVLEEAAKMLCFVLAVS